MKKTCLQHISKKRGNFSVWPELKEEIELELAQLWRHLEILASLREKIEQTEPNTVEVMALATFLHAFYNGVENVFKRVSIHLNGGPPRGEIWHSRLLDRMAQPGKNRPALISHFLRERLRYYLNFRHMFRHAYSFELQWSKMAPLVLEVQEVLRQLEAELEIFMQAIESKQG
jgi:hypothetical protein